jgi:carbonic anhydrase/acetyltransferase-like protein (isoleucine patch superfamily)
MRKFIIEDKRYIAPFNEPARELRILNRPLWLAQRDALAPYCETEFTVSSIEDVPRDNTPTIVYRDNLYFDQPFLDAFIAKARQSKMACRAAFSSTDKAFVSYAVPLSRGFEEWQATVDEAPLYLMDMWYFPNGYTSNVLPIVIDSEYVEAGYYSVPSYMSKRGDLVHYLTKRTVLSVESWIHLFYANVVMGIFSLGHRFEDQLAGSNFFRMSVLWRALLEQKQVLSCSKLVHIGEGSIIDPTAVIQGPTWIGRDCTIGPGVVIGNCYIGDNVNIAQGCELMLSVINNGCFLPFRASMFMSVLMENSIVAQNTCIQMCVIGRDSFIGAGTTFTDFNLLPTPLKLEAMDGKLEPVDQVVLGGCVGHNCRLGSGLIIYPARMIESDVILFASPSRRVIRKNISYEESDHHELRPEVAKLHKRLYPRLVVDAVGDAAYLSDW